MAIPGKLRKVLRIAFIVAVLVTIGMFWYDEIVYYFFDEYEEGDLPTTCEEGANVAVIYVYGEIVGYAEEYLEDYTYTTSDEVLSYLDSINQNSDIQAIIVQINSGGGDGFAGEEIRDALRRSEKLVIALVRGVCASAAYELAIGADKIYARETSDIGSIGVTMSYLDYSQQNKEEGLIFRQLSAGEFKDAGRPDKKLTEEERALFMRDINKIQEIFIETVAEYRNMDIETVREYADGSTMLGIDAKEVGLIDEIGDLEDVKQYLRDEFSIEPILCVYEK